MGPRVLQQYLDGAREHVVWIEYDRYAHRVFANSATDWLTQSIRYANTIIQARKAIPTEVLTVDIVAAGLAARHRALEPIAEASAVLADGNACRYTAECLDALLHKLGETVDIVLRVPVPADLLAACGAQGRSDFEAMDEISTAMVAALRVYSDKPIAGLLLVRASTEPLSVDEADAYGPLLNAAHHYGWVTCMALDAALIGPGVALPEGVDVLLCADLSLARVRECQVAGTRVGGGLAAAGWTIPGGLSAALPGDLLFGIIPEAANPETVLANCATLAG